MVHSGDGQALKLVEIADYLVDAQLRIPYKAETEPTDFCVSKGYLDIVMGGYLCQHLLQRDIVVDYGLHDNSIISHRLGRSGCDRFGCTFCYFGPGCVRFLMLPHHVDGCKGKARNKKNTRHGGSYLLK